MGSDPLSGDTKRVLFVLGGCPSSIQKIKFFVLGATFPQLLLLFLQVNSIELKKDDIFHKRGWSALSHRGQGEQDPEHLRSFSFTVILISSRLVEPGDPLKIEQVMSFEMRNLVSAWWEESVPWWNQCRIE